MLLEDPGRSTCFIIWMRKANNRFGYTVIHEDWNSGVLSLVKNSVKRVRYVQCCQAIPTKRVSVHKKKRFRDTLEFLPCERRD